MLSAPSGRTGPVRPPGAPAGRVPAEFIGKARLLRNKAGVAAAARDRAAERLLTPLRPKRNFTPIPTHDRLRRVAEEWRAMPAFGRLGLIANFVDGELKIAELRARPVRMRFTAWNDGEAELALAIAVTLVRVQPPAFREETKLLVDAGLHALARRFERGEDRSEAAVLADLCTLAQACPDHIIARGEFKIAAAGGFWLGAVTTVKGAPVLAVRTFVA
jgi:hypothetical protein